MNILWACIVAYNVRVEYLTESRLRDASTVGCNATASPNAVLTTPHLVGGFVIH